MQKKFFKKAMSAIIAFALVFSIVPAMGIASAADVGETTTFIFAPRLFTVAELTGTGSSSMPSGYDKNFLFNYLEVGESEHAPEYYRNWKLFRTNWRSDNTTDMENADVNSTQGLYFRYGSGSGWVAMKIKGFDAGTYNIKVKSYPQKGRNIALYVLDDAIYGNADVATITNAIANYSSLNGVEKIGNADFYGRPGNASEKLYDSVYSKTTDAGYYCINASLAEAEFGNVTFSGDASTEHIFVFKDEGQGVLAGNETSSSTEKYLSIAALSFTPVAATAKNANIFGNTAAFFEKTNADSCDLYLVSAIDSLDYAGAGFEVSVDGGESEELSTDTVYNSISFTNSDGSTTTYTSDDLGLSGKYLYVAKKTLDSFSGQKINFRPFAVTVSDETVEGSAYEVTMKK
ncbi:MAG: hypothetical protein IJO61_00175 [Oscillospiraceae bacterium]|nr:hypothetical protein [Oscillospiraceae bacterium]